MKDHIHIETHKHRHTQTHIGGTRGVVVIVIGNGHSDQCSIPGRSCLHFT